MRAYNVTRNVNRTLAQAWNEAGRTHTHTRRRHRMSTMVVCARRRTRELKRTYVRQNTNTVVNVMQQCGALYTSNRLPMKENARFKKRAKREMCHTAWTPFNSHMIRMGKTRARLNSSLFIVVNGANCESNYFIVVIDVLDSWRIKKRTRLTIRCGEFQKIEINFVLLVHACVCFSKKIFPDCEYSPRCTCIDESSWAHTHNSNLSFYQSKANSLDLWNYFKWSIFCFFSVDSLIFHDSVKKKIFFLT